jgi:geranylgeranyl diphosphate synthase, type II
MKKFLAYKEALETYIQNVMSERSGAIYEPVKYIMTLGGKRMRPALTLGTAEAFGTSSKKSMHIAAAIELFHNFTLLHDDIMDEASLRRGQETVHIKWNRDQAILSGDIMFALSYEVISSKPSAQSTEILRLFTKTAQEVCIGQQMDMDFEKRNSVKAEEYIEMIRLKTSVLLGAATAMGALVANLDEEKVKAMYSYGEQMGLAFQIQDDLLDTFSEHAEMGKIRGGDILQNKKTLLYIYALEAATDEQRKTILDHYEVKGGDEEKLADIRGIFRETAALDRVREVQEHYLGEAKKHLQSVGMSQEWEQEFLSMLSFQTERIS